MQHEIKKTNCGHYQNEPTAYTSTYIKYKTFIGKTSQGIVKLAKHQNYKVSLSKALNNTTSI